MIEVFAVILRDFARELNIKMALNECVNMDKMDMIAIRPLCIVIVIFLEEVDLWICEPSKKIVASMMVMLRSAFSVQL